MNTHTDFQILSIAINLSFSAKIGARFATIVLRGRLNPELTWWDVMVVGHLAAIGFTVALLVSQVSFFTDDVSLQLAKLAIVIANILAIAIALIAIWARSAVIGRYPVGD